MKVLSRAQVNALILAWRDEISDSMEQIRRSQDELLLEVGEENMPYALTATASILGKGGIIVSNTNTTNIGTAGVAVTGGTVTGNLHGTAITTNSELQKEVLVGLAKLRQALFESAELNEDQKEEVVTAIEDLEAEARKGDDAKATGRVRNALNTVTTILGLARDVEFMYRDVFPHLEALFHLAK